ncbi:hypothetical protein SH528x_004117 [Novipirellula sp. SH528]|uniref:hypothetical protein n=1 Tax=Novipirellula sp. SH528 TaxID=3454466 RepID=UPI003F9F921D
MGATETTTQQYIALEHPFNLPLIVLVTLLCAAVMLWALVRERRILGVKTTSLFLVLRVFAVAAVLWMLLAPTSVLEESTSTKKAVVILSDVSASMATVDPVGTADDLRWAISDDTEHSDSSLIEAVALADRTIAALGIAHRELSAAISELEKHGGERRVTEHVQLASKAITRSRMHLDQIRDVGTAADVLDSDAVTPLLSRLSTLLNSPECDALVDLAETLQRDRTPTEAGWREGLTDLVGRTAIARRVSVELAEQLSKNASAWRDPGVVASATFQNRARGQRVASFLNQLGDSSLDSIKETADVHWSFFDDVPRDLSSDNEAKLFLSELADRDDLAKLTDLSAGLRHVDRMRQNQPVAATFVLSDVAHNHASDRKPTEIATQMEGSPVYVIPIGNSSRLRDIDLISTSAPSVAMRNDAVVIEAQLEAYQCLGETYIVQLMQDGQVIDFRNVLIDSDSASQRVRFDQRVSEIGTATFQIAAEPLDGEMTLENNFGEVEINVTRSDIKVLLADEHPRWEYRYLAQLFRRDDKVEVDELLYHPRVIATGRREETKTFPITVDDWDQYDVVILGDIQTDHFPAQSQESLLQYLRTRGGTLIMIAGDSAMPQAYVDHPLAAAIPVRPIEDADDLNREYSFRVTEQGRSHVALMIGETDSATRDAWDFVNRFSPLHKVSRWRSPLPTARSLIAAAPRDLGPNASDAELSDSTFLCWQPVGRGRVVYLAGPDTYRLRFLRGDQLHYRFWGQLMRWAIASDLSAGNRSVRIRTSKTLYETNQSVDVEVELLDAEGNPVIEDSDATDVLHLRLISGEDERLVPLAADVERPGFYRADIRSLPPGVYQAQPGGSLVDSLAEIDAAESSSEIASATFTVQADLPTELVDTRCNRVLAGQVAELTGGQVLPPTAVSEIIELTNLDPVVTHRVQRQPLWLRWRYLWLVFGCLQIEWIVRKWRGLS